MDRRNFLKKSGVLATGWASAAGLGSLLFPVRLCAAAGDAVDDNPNLADPGRGATVSVSSACQSPPFSYVPTRIFGDDLHSSWETDTETGGAWLEIGFPEEQMVSEIWLLAKPLPYDIVFDPYTRGGKMQTPRIVTFSLGRTGAVAGMSAELAQSTNFQIITFPQPVKAKSVRITINEIWPEAGRVGTGLGKMRIFARPHTHSFDLSVFTMYDVHDGIPVQSATLAAISPGPEVRGAELQIARGGKLLMTIPMETLPAKSVVHQNIWIPAPFEDQDMEFILRDSQGALKATRKLRVPAYHPYFDGGTFDLLATNHNDLGWLDTQKITADYRSAELILPAMEIIKQYPDFRYSMESVAYLIEFLERHPEKRQEMAQLMRERKFVWGASYVQNLEVHVGPEKLARQFYLGRRWLRKNFPGCDTIHYCKTDPPAMTLQMPQILSKAGIKYVLQGRFTWGFYNWEAPDGSRVFVFAIRYADPLINPKGNDGWLQYAAEREDYYAARQLPPQMIFDFNDDYLPPPPSLPPYVHEQNAAMKRFAAAWNQYYRGMPSRQIKPPVIRFVEAEGTLEDFTRKAPNVATVKGDWPLSWTYYDEPGHREGLLAGREAHNRILAAERLYAGLIQKGASGEYPAQTFDDAWRANCWPDHGWGGNKGTETDRIYVESYQKSRALAGELLASATARLARVVPHGSGERPIVVVYNPVAWRRTDVARCRVEKPAGWTSFRLLDSAGKEIPCQIVLDAAGHAHAEITFIADDVPSVGYRTYHLEPSDSPLPAGDLLGGSTLENESLRAVIGGGGLSSLFDKRRQQEILKTDKFYGGEVLQFTAPGQGWTETESVTLEDFDKTSHHDFRAITSVQGPVFAAAVHEAQFAHFRLRETFRLYPRLDRVEIDVEVRNWDGAPSRELRVAFPINLPRDFRLSYEVPFGTVEMGKDELDFSLLPPRVHCPFISAVDGGDRPLPFREAINWIDASSDRFNKFGCLAASDCSVHLFADQTGQPVSYPVLQHVLISTRSSLAWDPVYSFTQAGSHHFRTALYPHPGGWRARYRDGIAFNYPLIAFLAAGPVGADRARPDSEEFLRLEPDNLIMTAFKKSEDDDSLALRFYEAEGQFTRARVQLAQPVRKAWLTNLIEEEPKTLALDSHGTLEFDVRPWEIVTLRLAV
jgi:alpha-mannosidase